MNHGPSQRAAPVYTSAIVIIPPEDSWAPIQEIRSQHDKSYVRWMPHINLIYGFVPEEYFVEAAELIADALRHLDPFSVALDRFQHFAHDKSDTIWLRPDVDQSGALHRLQATLQRVFPLCSEQSEKSSAGFHPHLTVGQCTGQEREQTQRYIETWQRAWQPIRFEVAGVSMISRRDKDPFAVRRFIDFASPRQSVAVASERQLSELRLGHRCQAELSWSFEQVASVFRLCLLNNDESGSMGNDIIQNANAFKSIAPLADNAFDAVIVHGFGSDSLYRIFTIRALEPLFARIAKVARLSVEVSAVASARDTVTQAHKYLRKRSTHGTTCPRSHPVFLKHLADALDAHEGSIDITVVNTSDGGFDGGAPQREIREQMLRIIARSRPRLVANVLVGSRGSPSALHFFTGDPDAFATRLLFSTRPVTQSEGVLILGDFDPKRIDLAIGAEDDDDGYVVLQPATPFWSLDRVADELLVYWPTDVPPPTQMSVRVHKPQPGNRELTLTAQVAITPEPVTIDSGAREMFALVARCYSDNPYIREQSRDSLNAVLAQLEGLLAKRERLLAELTARPDEEALLRQIKERLDDNLRAMKAAREDASSSLRDKSGRSNALNNARRLLKRHLHDTYAQIQQDLLERELAYIQAHPDHWTVWLQPAVDEIRLQLELTQKDVGDEMQHLSTRIRSRKSRQDGQKRSIDRHVERLQERARARNDRAERTRSERDDAPLEQPAIWLEDVCDISRASLLEGIAGLPFVADRRDITSGNVAAGGQNVDRMPVPLEPMVSLEAVRYLMWAPNGQMATPYCTAQGVYNAAIPVLLGPATPAGIRDLSKAIGWLCTGTSAFEAPMAEAIPAALAVVLGQAPMAEHAGHGPDSAAEATRTRQAHALLRTTALFEHFKSYPYVANTSVLDESADKLPLPEVWRRSLEDSGPYASRQNSGCTASLLAKAVGASTCAIEPVARSLFSWCCRNVALSILMDQRDDGRGGVEGIRRLAALFHLSVELDGYPGSDAASSQPNASEPVRPTQNRTADNLREVLSRDALAEILGPEVAQLWTPERDIEKERFIESLNEWMSGLSNAQMMQISGLLGGMLERFDRLTATGVTTTIADDDGDLELDGLDDAGGHRDHSGASSARDAAFTPITHGHFDILALEAVAPVRFTTEAPKLADANLRLRRMEKANAITWIAPRDAYLPDGHINASALAYLEAHNALQPIRALLRLHRAGYLGQERLQALRTSATAPPIPSVDSVFAAMSELLGDAGEVLLLVYRAFAFVVDNANGYADKHWTESKLRTASLDTVGRILGFSERPDESAAQSPCTHYGPAELSFTELRDHLDWPRMDRRGYLPRSYNIDSRGQPVGAPLPYTPELHGLSDKALCEQSFVHIASARVDEVGDRFTHGLHRQARSVLGACGVDASRLSFAEFVALLRTELLPRMAGKVRGVPEHPEFFRQCAFILWEMAQLGEDTRTFRGEEPAEFIAREAQRIRTGELNRG